MFFLFKSSGFFFPEPKFLLSYLVHCFHIIVSLLLLFKRTRGPLQLSVASAIIGARMLLVGVSLINPIDIFIEQ